MLIPQNRHLWMAVFLIEIHSRLLYNYTQETSKGANPMPYRIEHDSNTGTLGQLITADIALFRRLVKTDPIIFSPRTPILPIYAHLTIFSINYIFFMSICTVKLL